MNSLRLYSPAKLNLYLRVGKKRKDSYHNIVTLFERIGLKDRITLTLIKEDKIEIASESRQIPLDHTNLAYKAALALKKRFNKKGGVRINIKKRIPVSAGLGGGSSNAAYTLLGLIRLWRIRISRETIARLGRKLGADVAFFLYNASFAYANGRGDKVRPIKGIRHKFWHVLAVPDIEVSTKSAYQRFDRIYAGKLKPERLTMAKMDVRMLHNALKSKDFALISNNLKNDLDEVTSGHVKRVRRVKRILKGLGSEAVLMSGSGPAVFSILKSRKEAMAVKRRLGSLRHFRVIVAKTY